MEPIERFRDGRTVPTNGRTEDAAFPGHVCAVRRYALHGDSEAGR